MFKDKQGRWITAGLFTETAGSQKDFVIMSLDEAQEAFVELDDPTGYKFAKEYLGGHKHWRALEASATMAPHITDWQDELEVKIACLATQGIIKGSLEGSYQAQKYLADRNFTGKKVGRPSKATIEKEAEKLDKIRTSAVTYLNDLKG